MITKTNRLAVSVAVLFLAQGALACDYPERLEERIRVLERIVTEHRTDLKSEIERLK